MERFVGVVRDEAGLAAAVARLSELSERGCDTALTGLMIARAALDRRESRGAHWRSDYPGQIAPRHAVTTLAATTFAAAGAARAPQELTDA